MDFPDRKRGRMTPEDHAEIERLSAELKNPTPGMIARRISRHPATVHWYMLTRGLIERTPRYATRAYVRNGRRIEPYSPAQDARLTELLTDSTEYSSHQARLVSVAAKLTEEFGFPRNWHSVRVRAALLAAAPDGEL